MHKKSDEINDFSLQKAMSLAQSDAGKQLLSLLQSTESEKLNAAMEQAAAGDLNQVKKTMQELMASGKVQELVNKMRSDNHG